MSKLIIEVEGGKVVGAYSDTKNIDVIVINRDTSNIPELTSEWITQAIDQNENSRLITLPILKIGNKKYKILG